MARKNRVSLFPEQTATLVQRIDNVDAAIQDVADNIANFLNITERNFNRDIQDLTLLHEAYSILREKLPARRRLEAAQEILNDLSPNARQDFNENFAMQMESN